MAKVEDVYTHMVLDIIMGHRNLTMDIELKFFGTLGRAICTVGTFSGHDFLARKWPKKNVYEMRIDQVIIHFC